MPPHTFVISCPPMHLTVRAEDQQESNIWIDGLLHRAAEWREKALASGVAAQRAEASGSSTVTGAAGARANQHQLLPRDSVVRGTRPATPQTCDSEGGRQGGGAKGTPTASRRGQSQGAQGAEADKEGAASPEQPSEGSRRRGREAANSAGPGGMSMPANSWATGRIGNGADDGGLGGAEPDLEGLGDECDVVETVRTPLRCAPLCPSAGRCALQPGTLSSLSTSHGARCSP